MTHTVPDPPTQSGCTSCGLDMSHGFARGDRVVMIAPMTKRQAGVVTNTFLDKADVVVDGRTYPTTIHAKWLAREDEMVTVRVELRNDAGDEEIVVASGVTTDGAVARAEEIARFVSGDDSYVMNDWAAA